MSYLLNYKNWRALHESRALHEALKDVAPVPVEPGNEITGYGGANWPILKFDKANYAAAYGLMQKLLGKEAIPGGRRTRYDNSAFYLYNDAADTQSATFTDIIDGIMRAAGTPFPDEAPLSQWEEVIVAASPTLSTSTKVKLYGDGSKVNTVGLVTVDKAPGGDTRKSNMTNIIAYINSFNLQNWCTGDFTQYDPNKIVNSDRIVDLTAQSPAIIKERGFLYLVGTGATSIEGGERNTTTDMTQGKEAKTGSVAISFTVGKADIDADGVKVDANHPKVQEIGKKITDYLGEAGVIDSMVLTSSASPEFAPEKGGPKTLADYATKKKPTSGNAAPTSVVDLYDQNAKLAYDRGVNFSNALQQYLGGHLKANSIKVAWKISTDEPGGGRNISYNIATQSVAPKPIEKTSFQEAKVNVESDALTLYVYKVQYDASKVSASVKKGGLLRKGMIPYEKLTAGQKITILKTDMKSKGEVEVSKVENNTVYFKDPKTGEEKTLPKERYVSQVGKAKEEEAGF